MTVLLASGSAPSNDLISLAGCLGEVAGVRIDPAATAAQQAAALEQAAREEGAAIVVLPNVRGSLEVAALLAHRLGAALLLDVARVRRDGEEVVAEKRELGGTWDVECAAAEPVVIVAQPAPATGEVGPVREVVWPSVPGPERDVEVVSRDDASVEGAALGEAGIVVVGGRGLDGDLTPVRALADALGGAVGATRDIVEEGWIGESAMVGQTGTMIAPRLYIGAGLSGAPHHVLGMRAAETIVAINTDPDAPIMELADLAIIGDAAQVLSEAAALVRQRRGE